VKNEEERKMREKSGRWMKERSGRSMNERLLVLLD
jgi:hypothetical protein